MMTGEGQNPPLLVEKMGVIPSRCAAKQDTGVGISRFFVPETGFPVLTGDCHTSDMSH